MKPQAADYPDLYAEWKDVEAHSWALYSDLEVIHSQLRRFIRACSPITKRGRGKLTGITWDPKQQMFRVYERDDEDDVVEYNGAPAPICVPLRLLLIPEDEAMQEVLRAHDEASQKRYMRDMARYAQAQADEEARARSQYELLKARFEGQ